MVSRGSLVYQFSPKISAQHLCPRNLVLGAREQVTVDHNQVSQFARFQRAVCFNRFARSAIDSVLIA